MLAALKWLAHHQSPDGSWKGEGFHVQCSGAGCSGRGSADHDAGLTALSLLAFLGAGYTNLTHDMFPDPIEPGRTLDFGAVVKGAIQWLRSRQDGEGCIGERGSAHMYDHSIAALALSEAFGMTSNETFRAPAQRAVDFLIAAQNPGKGWRYRARSGDNDTSVTGWAVMALKSAELSDLDFPKSAYEGALSWLDEVTDSSGYYRVGYNHRGSGKPFIPGKNEQFDHHESMSAVAVMSRIFMQKNRREPALGAVHLLVQDLPAWQANKIDFYYWYYASMALFQFDGPDGPMFRKWYPALAAALVPNQKKAKDGCQNGSWAPEEERWGFEGGRVYATAINALTLEVLYRYQNVLGSERR